jgi:hypothetical protein
MFLFKGHNNYCLELILYIPKSIKNQKRQTLVKGFALLKNDITRFYFGHETCDLIADIKSLDNAALSRNQRS